MKLNHILYFIFFLVSCNSETNVETGQDYFDIPRFLKTTYPDSSSRILQAVKTISYNEEVSRQELINYDISEDLLLLGKMSINNPSWIGKYTIDSLSSREGGSEIHYTAIDPDMNIKKLIVQFSLGTPIGFKAEYERKSIISDLYKTIEFNKEQGYKIQNQSDRFFADPSSVSIEVNFGR